MESSFSGSCKRAKAPSHVTQVANCLVDGCNADLSLCRDYHRRHKVCEAHSKTSKVTIGGREQRFCQQCSRFHSLVEFDNGKRSCRKRLDGHNRRRRKPQADSLPQNSGLLFSTQPGTRLLSFSTAPQILPSSAVISSSWTGIVKPENNMALYNDNYIDHQNSFTESSSRQNSSKGVNVNQLQFMQGLDPDAARRTSKQLFCDGLNQVVDSDRALSLLSSAPGPTTTREFGLNHAVVQPVEPLPSQMVHDLHYNGLSHYSFNTTTTTTTTQESKMNVNAVESHGSNASTLRFPEMFHQGHEGSSSSGSHQTLTFTWE